MMALGAVQVDIVGAASRMCADLVVKYGAGAMSEHTGLTTSYLDGIAAGGRLKLITMITLTESEVLSLHGGQL